MNIVFHALQSAMFAMLDDEEELDKVWALVGGAETLPPNLPISTSSARFFIYCLSSLRTWISLDIFDSSSFINLAYNTAVL